MTPFDFFSLRKKKKETVDYCGQLSNKYTYFSYSPHDSSYQPPYPVRTCPHFSHLRNSMDFT